MSTNNNPEDTAEGKDKVIKFPEKFKVSQERMEELVEEDKKYTKMIKAYLVRRASEKESKSQGSSGRK
jgi:hypothetical protein